MKLPPAPCISKGCIPAAVPVGPPDGIRGNGDEDDEAPPVDGGDFGDFGDLELPHIKLKSSDPSEF